MLLSEKLFLIGIDDKSMKFSLKSDKYLFFGAVIMDLILKEMIILEGKKNNEIQIIDENLTEINLLDLTLNNIKKIKATSKEFPSLSEIYDTFQYEKIRNMIVSRLELMGIIKYLGKKNLSRRYQILIMEEKKQVLNDLQEGIGYTVERDQSNFKDLISLLSLLNVNANNKSIVGWRKLKKNKWLKNYVKKEPIGNWLKKQIKKEKHEMLIEDWNGDDDFIV